MQRTPEPELMVEASQVAQYVAAIRELELIAPTHRVFVSHAAKVIPRGGHVLDMGCGSGDPLLLLLKIRPDLTGIGVDLSETMLEFAKDRSRELGMDDRVSFDLCDITTLKVFENGTFDGVISTLCLHHLPEFHDLEAAMRSAARVLKEGGGMCLADFARLPSEKWVERFVKHDQAVQPALYERDFRNSMHAAWTVQEFSAAAKGLNVGLRQKVTWCLPFLQAISTPPVAGITYSAFEPLCKRSARQTHRFLSAWFVLGRCRGL